MTLARQKLKWIIAAAAGTLVLAAGFVLTWVLFGGSGERFAVVYARGSQNLYLAVPEGSFSLRASESRQQLFGHNALFYDSVTDDGLHLYVVLLRDANSRRAGGTRIAENIDENWAVSANGRQVLFLEQRGRRLFVYDITSRTAEPKADLVQALYAAPGQNVFFFTKREGDASVLFRGQIGRQPERMTGAVERARFFYDDQQSIMFYAADNVLFALKQSGGPVYIADNPAQVLFDAYEVGGNLYFLMSDQPQQALSITVSDSYAESDAAMLEPEPPPQRPGGLTGFLEDFFGGGNREAEYQRQRDAWEAKLRRDHLRAVVLNMTQDMPAGFAQMDLYVYNGVSVERLAEGVSPEGIAALRAHGRAAALFENEQADETAQATVTLAALQPHYSQGGEDAVREYLSTAAGERRQPAGWSIAKMTDHGANVVPLDRAFGGGAEWDASFLRAPDTMLYLESNVEGGYFRLFVYDLMDFGLSARRFLATEVTETAVGAQGLYFRRQELSGARGTLYFYHSGADAERVLGNVGAFFFTADRTTLLALNDVREGSGTLSVCVNAEAREIGQNVRIDGVRPGSRHTGFIANWQDGSGELWVSDHNRPAQMLSEDVTDILAVN